MFQRLTGANDKKTTNSAMNVADVEGSGHFLATRSEEPRRQTEQSPLYTPTRALVYSEWTMVWNITDL